MTEPKPTALADKALTDTANSSFTIQIGDTAPANLPANTNSTSVSTPTGNGGLTYANAYANEREEMDKIIATIDLTNPESVINLGSEERNKLADLADRILDSIQPGAKLAFAQALKDLIDLVSENSLDQIKDRITDGTAKRIGKKLLNSLKGKDAQIEETKELIGNFMTDVSQTRKSIAEMVDTLQLQQKALNTNYGNINALGSALSESSQRMRLVQAATSEYIRRVESGEITQLNDLREKATTSGRADDTEKLQIAEASWNNVRNVDASLLGSISVYDMQVAGLAFTKQANIQNRMQTSNTLTTTVSEWKSQLAFFAIVTEERAAAQIISVAGQLTEASIKQNKNVFDMLVDATLENATKGTYNLRQLIDVQGSMVTKLQSVGPQLDAQFKQLEEDKAALKESSAKFRQSVVEVYSNKSGILSTAPKAPKPAV